ncbi:MAG TPA: TerC family protein [Candidatus Limnocylindrales bacterium]|nr:TerC family protein [Candidatus Limnocylindrales bacterium]
MPDPTVLLVAAFAIFVLVALALDLGVFHRDAHVVTTREALTWTVVWVSLAVLFGVGVFVARGPETAIAYATGYVIEYSLSVDNVFVFSLIFAAFAVPRELQHRVLFWGVIGALVMRLVMIAAGAALIEQAGWILYLFGGFLVITGIRMLVARSAHAGDPARNPFVRLARRVVRVHPTFDGQRFFTPTAAGRAATPLFLALVAVEASDLVFAVDSIPAIFAVTTDPFVVFTSNAFAILGLRSLYFLLADAAARFRHLKTGLALILVLVGAKLLLADWLHLPPLVSLGAIIAILAVAVIASLRDPGQASARGLRATG